MENGKWNTHTHQSYDNMYKLYKKRTQEFVEGRRRDATNISTGKKSPARKSTKKDHHPTRPIGFISTNSGSKQKFSAQIFGNWEYFLPLLHVMYDKSNQKNCSRYRNYCSSLNLIVYSTPITKRWKANCYQYEFGSINQAKRFGPRWKLFSQYWHHR